MKFVNFLRELLRNTRLAGETAAEVRRANMAIDGFQEMVGEFLEQQQVLQRIQIELLTELAKAGAANNNAVSAVLPRLEQLVQEAKNAARPVKRATMSDVQDQIKKLPLMIDAKTYNTSHPQYNPAVVRNFPGRILSPNKSCRNPVYLKVSELSFNNEVPDPAWRAILDQSLREAQGIPSSAQIFERHDFIERYMEDLRQRYHAFYVAGWVNLDDALFLYWLVRNLKPKTIIQTGVCNGLSAAFMVLALAKNGGEGVLRAIDLPPIFDSKDPAWTIRDKVYGVVIPEGKSSGWIVPDAHRDRFEVWTGDAKELMPKLINEVGSVDMFYHDSDHTYDHMMFEFKEAKRKLTPGGLVVADDISWNSSLWDFADQCGVPSYNYKGAVGAAFF